MWMPLTLSYGALNLPLFLVRERIESDIRWGLKDPESGEEAQTLGRPARDRRLPLPKICEDRVVA